MPERRALLPAVSAATVVLTAVLLYSAGWKQSYYSLAEAWGAAPFRTPFLDTHGLLASVECHRLGFDVYTQNPCDVFGRVHNYSPLWLWLAVLPITTAWSDAVGCALALLFVVCLAFLPAGRDRRGVSVIALGVLSSAPMFAVERANIDVVIFALALLAARLRRIGEVAALIAGLLKFYPLVLLVLAMRRRPVVCVAIWSAAIIIVALWLLGDGRAIMRSLANMPVMWPFDNNSFGAPALPLGIATLLGLQHVETVALQAVLLAVMAGCAVALARRTNLRGLTGAEATFLLAGCALMTACFVLTQNVSYRAIYFLFVLPGLTVLGAWWLAGLIVLLMWNGALNVLITTLAPGAATQFVIWIARELAWWVTTAVLMALLLRLLTDSRAAREIIAHFR